MKTFFEKTPISGKMPTFLENFRRFSCEKTLYPNHHLALIICLLTSTSAPKNYDGWDAFTKRVLVEKHISDIMCENPGRITDPLHLLPTPMVDTVRLGIRIKKVK